MTRHFIPLTLLSLMMTAPVSAQTPSSSGAGARRFTIGATVLAGGAPLAPGTYEIRIVGASDAVSESVAQRTIEIVSNGKVVAHEVAEIVPASGLVGTSGSTSRVRVEKLKEGDFVRVSFVEGSDRYLIYLPIRE
jgi:hypothetical protein